MSDRETALRDARIVEDIRHGATYQSVAQQYGLSRERVRQIGKRAGFVNPRKGRPSTAPTRPCEQCGAETRNAAYCSRSCRAAARAHPCAQCGVGTRNDTYCSRSCFYAAQRTRPSTPRALPTHPCVRCGVETSNQQYCGLACFYAARRVLPPTHPCEQCGAETSNERYCSRTCQGAAQRDRPRIHRLPAARSHHARTLKPKRKDTDPIDRFWETYHAKTERVGDCVEWRGRTSVGHAVILHHGQRRMVRRLVYQFTIGALPDDRFVFATCNNPRCVRDSHLDSDTKYNLMAKMRDHRNIPSGESHWKAKLTAADIPRIVALREAGMSARAIAAQYEVSHWTIREVLRGDSWKHIPREVAQ